jgi:DNA replication licensing factor MCM2
MEDDLQEDVGNYNDYGDNKENLAAWI